MELLAKRVINGTLGSKGLLKQISHKKQISHRKQMHRIKQQIVLKLVSMHYISIKFTYIL